MKLDQKAKQYSEALFNVAVESQSEIEVKDSLINVCNAIRNSAEFRSFLLSKRVSSSDKAKATKEVFGSKCHEIISELIALSNNDNLVKIMPLIRKHYNLILADKKNIVNVTADVTVDLSEDRKAELKKLLDQSLKKNTEISFKVNPDLIGGIRLRVGNELVDASIGNHLKNMRQEMLDA
jgi:F-type H+-transporting ATPase subunit delta